MMICRLAGRYIILYLVLDGGLQPCRTKACDKTSAISFADNSVIYKAYCHQLREVGSMGNPPEFSHLDHHLIHKNGIGRFRKQF